MISNRTVLRVEHVEDRNADIEQRHRARRQRMRDAAASYFGDTTFDSSSTDSERVDVSAKLTHWITNSSWQECPSCNSSLHAPLVEGVWRGRRSTPSACDCRSGRYSVPKLANWPNCLRNLSAEDQELLSLYSLKCGNCRPKQHGYPWKDGPVYVILRESSPRYRISQVNDDTRRNQLLAAYDFLIHSTDSAYGELIDKYDSESMPPRMTVSQLFQTTYVETAIWPIWYAFKNLCESSECDSDPRKSSKKSYQNKVLSGVYDYCDSFPLLRYHYDKWIFKTVSGAISSSAAFNCSPARALDSKPFSPTFWEWQLSYIVDAVRQYGFPDIFLTISPYEWTFPMSESIQKRMKCLGRGATGLGTVETFHYAHILEQLLRRYVSGKDKKNWKSNLLRNVETGECNVKCYFYRQCQI